MAAVTDARGMTKRVSRGCRAAVMPATESAERLLASQRKFAGTCCARPRRCSPARAAPAPPRAAARPSSPHLPGGPGPPPAIGLLPGGGPIAVRRGLAYHREQRARSTELRSDSDRYLERAEAQCLGAFIRNRRKLARLSLRQLAEMTSLSNPYLSQLERGLHLPSLRVLKLFSGALNVSVETLLAQAGLLDLAPSGDGAAAADEPSIAGGVCHQRRPAPGRRAEGRADRRLPQHVPPLGPRTGQIGRGGSGSTPPGRRAMAVSAVSAAAR